MAGMKNIEWRLDFAAIPMQMRKRYFCSPNEIIELHTAHRTVLNSVRYKVPHAATLFHDMDQYCVIDTNG